MSPSPFAASFGSVPRRNPTVVYSSLASSVCRYSTKASATSRTQCLSTFSSTIATGFSIITVDGGMTISSSSPAS
jgi:hypothetical protein